MGMRATLWLRPAEYYEAVRQDPKADVGGDSYEESFDIDKAWNELHEALIQEGEPLKYAIEGEYCPYGNFAENESGANDGFVSSSLAARISDALEALPFAHVLDAVRQWYLQRLDLTFNDDDYLKSHFETLKRAYRTAKERGMTLHIGIF